MHRQSFGVGFRFASDTLAPSQITVLSYALRPSRRVHDGLIPLHVLQPLQEIRIVTSREVKTHLVKWRLLVITGHGRRLRAQDLVEDALQRFSALIAYGEVAFAWCNGGKSGYENTQILDRL